MKKILFIAAVVFFGSCKVSKVACKHQILIPVVFQTDQNTFYTVNVPFCDTVQVTPKPKPIMFGTKKTIVKPRQ